MKETREQKIEKMVEECAKIIKEDVQRIEGKPETTKDHYGDYASLLSVFSGGQQKIVALACIKAGAHPEGIRAAMGMLTGSIFN